MSWDDRKWEPGKSSLGNRAILGNKTLAVAEMGVAKTTRNEDVKK